MSREGVNTLEGHILKSMWQPCPSHHHHVFLFVSPAGVKGADWLTGGLGPVLPPSFFSAINACHFSASCQHLAVLTLLPGLRCEKCSLLLHNMCVCVCVYGTYCLFLFTCLSDLRHILKPLQFLTLFYVDAYQRHLCLQRTPTRTDSYVYRSSHTQMVTPDLIWQKSLMCLW